MSGEMRESMEQRIARIRSAESAVNKVKEKIAATFLPDAISIVGKIENSSLCIVTGPFFNGKTTTLLPMVKRLLEDKGEEVRIIDAQEYPKDFVPVLKKMFPELAEGKRVTVLIDEAGGLVYDSQGAQKCFQLLQFAGERGYRVVPIIAYSALHKEVRDELIATWGQADALLRGEGSNIAVVNLGPKRLSKNLAREYFLALNARRIEPFSHETVDSILDIIPPSLHTLYHVTSLWESDMWSVIRFLSHSYLGRKLGMLTKEEVSSMDNKCHEYIKRLYSQRRGHRPAE